MRTDINKEIVRPEEIGVHNALEGINFAPYVGLADFMPSIVFATLLDIRAKIVLMVSGNRLGKTKLLMRKLVFAGLGMCKHPETNIRPDTKHRTIRIASELLPNDKENEVGNTTYPHFKYQMPSTFIKKDITARVPVVTVNPPFGGGQIQYEFVSYGQSTQAQAGVDRWAIFADEVCPYEFYEESLPRLATTNGQFLAGCTPVEAGWMYTELYERAKMYVRTPSVRAFLKKQYGQDVKQIEKTGSKNDICVLQAATDDNPIFQVLVDKERARIATGEIKDEDFPYLTVGEYLDSVFMFDDPDTIAMRRYGVFRQISGAVFKQFQWNVHMIEARKYFQPEGIIPNRQDWKFGRSIDYHQSVPWAIIWAALSPDDELFIFDEMNPDPHNYTTAGICLEMMQRGLEAYKYRVNLIDKLANETQPNINAVNRTARDEINFIFREHGRLSFDKDTSFEAWDDRTRTGQDKIRERLINSKICSNPFNNRQKINGRVQMLPTIWILDNCRQMGLSLKNWKQEEWIDRDAIITKDPKDKQEMKWSHFNKALECLLKDSRFKVHNTNYMPRGEDFLKKTYFGGH